MKRPNRRLLLPIIVVVTILSFAGFRYRRELYVWFMLDCYVASLLGGESMREALLVNNRLFSERLDRAHSDTERLRVFRLNLSHSHSWHRTCAIRHLDEQPERIRKALCLDLITVIEFPVGDEASLAIEQVKRIHPLPENVIEPLMNLARSAKQGWKRQDAFVILFLDRRTDPQVFALAQDMATNDPSEIVRSTVEGLARTLDSSGEL